MITVLRRQQRQPHQPVLTPNLAVLLLLLLSCIQYPPLRVSGQQKAAIGAQLKLLAAPLCKGPPEVKSSLLPGGLLSLVPSTAATLVAVAKLLIGQSKYYC